jgi:hypothetical protein
MCDDGGYYAIKGFSFQFIISIKEILNSDDIQKMFYFENEQDFNDELQIYQMKYKETKKYLPSNIKEAVIKLLEQYKNNKKKNVLYAYFTDKSEEEVVFNSVEQLDKILLNCKIDDEVYDFSTELKEQFIQDFKLIFSKKYDDEVENTINLIKKEMNCSYEVAKAYFYQLFGLITMIIANNQPKNRAINKEKIINYFKDNSSNIFYDYYMRINKTEKYIKFIKKEYFFERNINFHYRFFVINVNNYDKEDKIIEIIISIIKKYCIVDHRRKIVKSPAPFIYINNISEEKIISIKNTLYNAGYILSDGYPFKGSKFLIKRILQNNYLKDEICLKMLNSLDDLKQTFLENNSIPKRIFQFYESNCSIIDLKDNGCINIEVNDVNDIIKIIN